MQIIFRIFVFLGLLIGAGCAAIPDDPNSPSFVSTSTTPLPTTLPDATPQATPPPMTPPATSTLQTLIDLAKADLSQRLSVSTEAITLVEAKGVTWSDSSLGCPQEGFAYSQVLTPGYLIVLEYDSNRYEYHAGKGPGVLYCPNPQPPVPNDPGNT